MKYKLILLAFVLFACGDQSKIELPPIQGEEAAIIYANEFLKAVGGRDKWSELEVVYTKYKKSEEAFQNYTSDEWISMTSKELLIDQQIEGLRNVRLLAVDTGFTVNEGSVSTMADNLYNFLGYFIEQDYYRNVSRLARGEDVKVAWTNRNQLLVTDLETGRFIFGFAFDDVWLPYQYLRPKFNEQDISINILEWEEFDDLMIPKKGKTDLETYVFEVADFKPCYGQVDDCFNITFDYDYVSSLEDK